MTERSLMYIVNRRVPRIDYLVSIKHGLGLQTTDCRLGIKHGLGIKCGLRNEYKTRTRYEMRTTDCVYNNIFRKVTLSETGSGLA